jgi:hypothetical protein
MFMRIVGWVCLLALTGSGAVAAQPADQPKITVEFNSLQAAEGGCRAVFVLRNGLAAGLDKLTLRLVTFDAQNHANLFLSLDVGALPATKTRVLRFDLGKGVACTDVSRLVLDDVTACGGGDMNPAKCLDSITVSTRAGIPFDL